DDIGRDRDLWRVVREHAPYGESSAGEHVGRGQYETLADDQSRADCPAGRGSRPVVGDYLDHAPTESRGCRLSDGFIHVRRAIRLRRTPPAPAYPIRLPADPRLWSRSGWSLWRMHFRLPSLAPIA